MEQRSFIRA